MTRLSPGIGVVRGTALFVSAIIGPGILTLPAIAASQAGPASLLSLGALLLISVPVAFTFVALNTAVPDGSGVSGYAAAAFGPGVGRMVTAWFRFGIPIGVPAVGLIGGEHVAAAFGGGEAAALTTAAGICLVAIVLNVLRRPGTGFLTTLLAAALVALVMTTAVLAMPHADAENLTPIPLAPNAFVAVSSSILVLTWVLTGWEAVTNFNGVLRDPRRTLPRVTAATLIIVAVLYGAVAFSEILVLGPTAGSSAAPIAELLRVTVGPAGAMIAAVFAVAIALGNSLAYVGSLTELGVAHQSTRRTLRATGVRLQALVIPTAIIGAGLAVVAFTPIGIAELVSICAGSQVPVYVIGLASAIRLLPSWSGRWWLALVSTVAVSVLLIPAGPYLLVPAGISAGVLIAGWVVRRREATRRER